jgi:glycosyltransferase involved in cell wall biosynthesis
VADGIRPQGPERRLTPSTTHLVLIPSFNPGNKGVETVRAARKYWAPVWVVVDGSTDGTAEELATMGQADVQLRVILRPTNGGKGAALFDGLLEAERCGFTHALTMDSDGQHPAQCISRFMDASIAAPDAMILGVPIFDASAPSIRVRGRKISNWAANLETLYAGIQDSLFGFRVYPIASLITVMRQTRWMRRFDFDAEAVVRLSWRGIPAINLPSPVRYFQPTEGGVSHFRYWRDNLLLTSMYLRLTLGWIVRIPLLVARRLAHRI